MKLVRLISIEQKTYTFPMVGLACVIEDGPDIVAHIVVGTERQTINIEREAYDDLLRIWLKDT